MAGVIYPTAKKNILDGEIDLLNDNIIALLMNASYSYNATHEFLSDVVGGADANVVARGGNLASKSITLSGTKQIFDAANLTISAVNNGTATSVIVAQNSGVDATSRVIMYDAITSIVTNGSDIIVTWSDGTDKIFSID